jgi:hypothetical protein
VPAETYSAIDFSQPSQESLSPSQLMATLENIFSTLMTGVITDPALRNEGLCLLEGYYTPFRRRHSAVPVPDACRLRGAVHGGRERHPRGGFFTGYDYNQAVKAAQAAPVP